MYWRLVLASIRAQMQYKVSFLLSTFGAFLVTGIEVVGIWALFSRFGNLPGWTLAEVAVFYGIVNVSFAASEFFTAGFDRFGTDFLRTGHFDRLLVRPRSLFVQLVGYEFTLRRLGRLLQGLIVLTWALVSIEQSIAGEDMVYLVFIMGCGVFMFFGIFVCQATLSFWTIESLEIMNTLTYGGVEAAQYPMSIYEEWFRRFFTYIVPVACVAYYPVLVLLGKAENSLLALTPLAGLLFFAASLWVFVAVGVRQYTSAGS